MKYEDMKSNIFATAVRPEGHNGETIKVGLALHDGRLYEVHKSGYHESHLTGSRDRVIKDRFDGLSAMIWETDFYTQIEPTHGKEITTLWDDIENLKEDGHLSY